jgi:hypothetical protein
MTIRIRQNHAKLTCNIDLVEKLLVISMYNIESI